MSWLVLLIEDDDDIRETLAAILAARGFHVVAAAEGRSALQQIHAMGSRPAVILLDLQMPVMDGETFLQEQKADALLANVPVLVITAQLLLPPSFPPNVRAVYTKPISLAEILAAIQSACEAGGTAPPALANGTGSLEAVVPGVEPPPAEPPPPVAAAADRPGSDPGTPTE
jgi:two-component system, chemotaxis family, chemotaxis protein CheY